MNAIRNLIRRYPVAAIVIVVVVAGFGAGVIYQSRQAEQRAVRALPGRTAVATPPATPPTPSSVTPSAPAGQAPVSGTTGLGASPVPPTSSGAGTSPRSSGRGRANPFEPIAGTSSPGSSPPGTSAMPPVPPLPAGAPSSAASPALSVPAYKVVGLLWADRAVAILEDGSGSYVVAPGDTVGLDVRILTIDVQREVVRLSRGGTPIELSLVPLRRRP